MTLHPSFPQPNLNQGNLAWSPTETPNRTARVDYAIEASRLVTETLQNIGNMSGLPILNEAAGIALRIFAIVQDIRSRNQDFTDLANDACGLVYTIVIECQAMMKDGQQISSRVQTHIATLSGNLAEIEKFAKRKLKRGAVKKLIYHSKDLDEITRFRALLRQSLDIFGIQSSLSIQQNLQLVLKKLENQSNQLSSAQERQRLAEEEMATRLEIIRIQEEDREAERLEALRRSERERLERLEREEKRRRSAERAERQKKEEEESLRRLKADSVHFPEEPASLRPPRIKRTPSPQPIPYAHPHPQHGFPPPSSPYVHPGYPIYGGSPYHLVPPISPPGVYGISNISGSAISLGMAPVQNWNSGNVNNTTIENVGNNYSGRRSPRRPARRNDSESDED
ncbi:hypothetical protein GALMADRAFT_235357 [Galerina marginata CBS 339.88]|uniref:Uncharacterized protein n=1 Tax=Galerina marginata (strain CBS 339.88) TaxID=685588 RepID=A0A067TSC2_GALM3|nr:hypothetical protein GALMADRAFT_235357 [Galerina marginata CBS 339.88]